MTPQNNKLVTLMGQRLTKREPILDSKTGDVIDDGSNVALTLASNFPQWAVETFMANLTKQYPKKVWKFWIV